MHVFLEVLQLAAIWSLGWLTCSSHIRHKQRQQVRRNAKYKIKSNSLYGKKDANVQVPRHLNGTVCLDPATCKEHDAVSKYPNYYPTHYRGEFPGGDDSQ